MAVCKSSKTHLIDASLRWMAHVAQQLDRSSHLSILDEIRQMKWYSEFVMKILDVGDGCSGRSRKADKSGYIRISGGISVYIRK